ncbi:MAG: hypothetical protein A2Y74_08160 [Actinobacteria bacterium RBG_13_63_9]|nr:MAG: hypothetical protein A2Y74_08160 [Actinobacteria bacterium RBG_13_63_9]
MMVRNWSRALITASAMLVFAAVAPRASADVTFPVSISGVIYRSNDTMVRVDCSLKESNTVNFVDGDSSVDTLPAFTLDPSCELDSSQGFFTDAEQFNGVTIDDTQAVNIVTDPRGLEVLQGVGLKETAASGPGNIEMTLTYSAKFPYDGATHVLIPPILGASGNMVLINDSALEVFVGTWRTGRPLPPPPAP